MFYFYDNPNVAEKARLLALTEQILRKTPASTTRFPTHFAIIQC